MQKRAPFSYFRMLQPALLQDDKIALSGHLPCQQLNIFCAFQLHLLLGIYLRTSSIQHSDQ